MRAGVPRTRGGGPIVLSRGAGRQAGTHARARAAANGERAVNTLPMPPPPPFPLQMTTATFWALVRLAAARARARRASRRPACGAACGRAPRCWRHDSWRKQSWTPASRRTTPSRPKLRGQPMMTQPARSAAPRCVPRRCSGRAPLGCGRSASGPPCPAQARGNEMLLCDCCDMGYHLGCLTPPLEKPPLAFWFCKGCVNTQVQGGARVFRVAASRPAGQPASRRADSCSSAPQLNAGVRGLQSACGGGEEGQEAAQAAGGHSRDGAAGLLYFLRRPVPHGLHGCRHQQHRWRAGGRSARKPHLRPLPRRAGPGEGVFLQRMARGMPRESGRLFTQTLLRVARCLP